MKITGSDNIPKTGGFILACNHISYYDPPLAGSCIRREVHFFAKKELFSHWLFGKILRAVNALPVRRGAIDRNSLDLAVKVLERGYGLTIFPEGTRSKTDEFLPPKPGIGVIAIRAGCPIVPAYLHGSNRLKDCFKKRGLLSIRYGEPIPGEWVQSLPHEKESYLEVSRVVMARIAELKSEVLGLK